jgi:ZipA-like protein with FtsZ-binding domain
MSELQTSLLIIGGVVIAGVYAFNWLQERRLRRRLEEAFGGTREDALMQEPAIEPHDQRIEPQLQMLPEEVEAAAPPTPPAEPEPMASAAEAPGAAQAVAASGLDAALDFVVEIRAGAPIGDTVVGELLSKAAACGKPCRAVGWNEASGAWEELSRGGANRYSQIQIGVQLVNRSGALSTAQLAAFCDAVKSCAGKIGAQAACGDIEAALERARAIDALCADVDVAIGVNVIAQANQAFAGSRIRGLAEAAGLHLEPDGVFRFRDAQRRTLFTLDNHEPAPFIPEQIKSVTTSGITLLLDVPRVADGRDALRRMLDVGGQLARGLGGELVDDNRVALSKPAVATIQQQLDALASRMAAHGIEAGSERALRLFS